MRYNAVIMSMKDAVIVEGLSSLKERLRALDAANAEDIIKTVGIDLYNYIQHTPSLREQWARRENYLKNLQRDPEYRETEKEAVNVTCRLAEAFLSPLGIAMGREKKKGLTKRKLKRTYRSPLKNGESRKGPSLNLEEWLHSFLRKEDYHSLHDIEKDFADIPLNLTDVWRRKIIRQHRALYEFSKTILKDQNGEMDQSSVQKVSTLNAELLEKIIRLEQHLATIPAKLRLGDFDVVRLIAASYHSGISALDTFRGYDLQRTKMELGALKRSAIVVCDTLLWELTNIDDKDITIIKGILINKRLRIVEYKGITSKEMEMGKLPWTIIRTCAADPLGQTDLSEFLEKWNSGKKKKSRDDIHNVLNKINKPWRENIGEGIIHVCEDSICIEPH